MAKLSKERIKKLKARKKKIDENSGQSGLLFIKANSTLRVRALPVDENEEFGMEVIQFYLGAEIKGVLSPHTIGQPCALYQKWQELKNSKKAADKELADKMKPKTKYVIPVIKFSDTKGSAVDERTGVRLLLVTSGPYQKMVDYSLDAEHGDFTDPVEGYDFKITRTGSTMTDTEYSVLNCKSTALPKKYNKIYAVGELLAKELPSYEETKDILKKYMGSEDEEEAPKKKKKKKKKPSGDLG